MERTESVLYTKKRKYEKGEKKKLNVIKLWNTKNYILVALISLMLITSFAASNIVTVKASPAFPWSITLHATETTNPYYGYYGGYHDVWYAIRSELAKIGINLVIDYYDDFTWWSHTSSSTNWNKNATAGGWDMYIQEWWLQPHAIEPWFSSMVLSYLQPPQGYNLHPWNNSKADELLEKALQSFDAQTRQYYLWKWQEVFMQDPPWINIYYPRVYEVMGAWVDGYDPTGCWWYDTTNLSLSVADMPNDRKTLNTDWLYYAVSEDVWNLLPLFMDTYTEEQMGTLQWRTLYRWSIKWENYVAGEAPAPTDYIIVPDLAAKDPYAVGGNYSRMRVELREGVKWSDFATSGQYVDAADVEFTFNDLTLDKKAKSTGLGDFIEVIDRVEIVNNTAVDFILKNPAPDLKSILANDWGTGSPLPYHRLSAWEADPTLMKSKELANTEFDDATKWLPVNGPFKLKQIVPGEFALLERNPLYFGFDESIVGSPAWGPDESIQAMYLKWVPDAAVRLLEFQTHKLDVGEYPTAPVEVWQDLATDPYLNVFQYDYPAGNPIWLNFHNDYLSNRFIRLAIAHAVPFEKITSEILPSWGIETAYPGKTYILPIQYYTEPNTPDPELNGDTVHLFNTELEAWHYDIQKAEDYMWLWYNSTTVSNSAIGAVGDANYGGLVDLDDFLIWSANTETGPDTWPQTVVPGNIIDPDFNNDNNVDPGTDFPLWASHYGVEY